MPSKIILKHKGKKCPYLEAHAYNVLSSALNTKIKDEIDIEYDLLERPNLF
jgi:hypothetical protein